MDLALLNLDWFEIWIMHRDLRQGGNAVIVAFRFLEDLGATQQGLQVLRVASVVLVEDSLEEAQGLLLQVLLHRRQVDPASDGLRSQIGTVALKTLVDDLASLFELADVPEETGRCN